MKDEHPFGEPIYSYSRAQAIRDGILADLTQIESMRHHWKVPIACTAAVWTIVEQAAKREGQDVPGICHDISTMAKLGFAKPADIDRVYFKVIIAGSEHTLKLHIGPGDAGEPVLTLMLPDED
jgi:hypothetical protein